MSTRHGYADRIEDPSWTLVKYELDRRHREVEQLRLRAQVRSGRAGSMPARALLGQWLGARLSAWARVRQNPRGAVMTAELPTAVPGQR